MSDPLVSVIIPAHNEERHLPNAMMSISNQTYRNIELIVVDDNSLDGTKQAYSKGMFSYDLEGRTSRYESGKFGSAAGTRNAGAKLARGDIIIFHDADCIADEKMVARVVYNIDFLGFDGVATKTDVVKPKTMIERAIRAERSISWEMNQEKAVEIEKGAPVLVANMTHEAFTKLGGFNENIFYFEDQNLTDRFFDAGFHAVFDPEVIEYHNDPSTLKEQIGQSISNGKGIRTLLRQGKVHKLLIPLYPFAFLAGIASLILGNPILSAILWSPLAFILLILMEKSNDFVGSLTFLPLFLMRNTFKLWGAIKG